MGIKFPKKSYPNPLLQSTGTGVVPTDPVTGSPLPTITPDIPTTTSSVTNSGVPSLKRPDVTYTPHAPIGIKPSVPTPTAPAPDTTVVSTTKPADDNPDDGSKMRTGNFSDKNYDCTPTPEVTQDVQTTSPEVSTDVTGSTNPTATEPTPGEYYYRGVKYECKISSDGRYYYEWWGNTCNSLEIMFNDIDDCLNNAEDEEKPEESELEPQTNSVETPDEHKSPTVKAQTYTVQRGDNLWKIATSLLDSLHANYTNTHIANFVNAIAKESHLKNANIIYPGQELQIPEFSL